MPDLITVASSTRSIVPHAPLTTRLATVDDVPFMDDLQKRYNKQLGFFPTAQLEGYVKGQWVLIAQDATTGERLGFCASRDRYLKRDELGVIYLLCVVPGVQRKLIGASLIKAVFERSAYGCRLYCCWCAQDIAANHFWESLGFVPLAFRAGSTGKKRVHIFWQRRIDEQGKSEDGGWKMEDGKSASSPSSILHSPSSPTPYWYPFQTNAGAIRQDRLVFPIPPGVHWKDVRAVVVPTLPTIGNDGNPKEPKKLEGKKAARPAASKRLNPGAPGPGKIGILVGGKIKYVDRPRGGGYVPEKPAKAPRAKAEKPPAPKFDPKYLTAARELRDRYLERVNTQHLLGDGKYDVSRHLQEPEPKRTPLLIEQTSIAA